MLREPAGIQQVRSRRGHRVVAPRQRAKGAADRLFIRILYRPGPGVVHHAWRTPAQRARLKRDYGVGQGAFYAKHLARADAWIAWRLVRDLVRTARASGGAALRGVSSGGRGRARSG